MIKTSQFVLSGALIARRIPDTRMKSVLTGWTWLWRGGKAAALTRAVLLVAEAKVSCAWDVGRFVQTLCGIRKSGSSTTPL